jgi:UDP-glucose 4-epimerase
MTKYFIAGGAGFIGSHLIQILLQEEPQARIVVFDNFSSGREWHLSTLPGQDRLEIIRGDLKEINQLTPALQGCDVVYHFASNPDIAKAMTQPDIDFWEGTYLTSNLLEAMRKNQVKKLIYASGSGIYGETGLEPIHEDHAPLLPISTYGASKLACEALICSYSYLFGIQASAFRFANVVGPHQTHGVGYDFLRKLFADPSRLDILGDGTQSKSYIYVDDVIAAIRLLEKQADPGFTYYNVATEDAVTVREIADMAVGLMGLKNVAYHFSGGDRGWKGDVPVIRMNSEKIRRLGWRNRYTSREAMAQSLQGLHNDARQNKFSWPGATA